MSLRVWLPLLGNTDNQGLSDIIVVNNGATVDNSGKLGKCYSFGTSTSYLTLSNDAVNKCTTECSFSFWLNITSWNTSYATYFQAGLGGTPWAHYIFGVLRSGAGSNLCFTISNGSSASNVSYTTPNLELNTWYHLTCVYKTGHCLIYINGELYKDYATTIVPNFSGITKTTVGACNNGSSYQTNCKLNDIRIYDHALSPKEVSEIAKGLVCHYPLNNRFIGNNLILNGFGQDGLLGWSNSNYSTTEIPSTPNYIKASYTTNNTTTDFLPISHDTTYTFSEYLKASTTSGTTYPSILPYDIDKNFIGNNQCAVGFSPTWRTTLSQPLNPGDTVVHATDLSSWTTDTTSHYYYVAVFGYTDSTGRVYKDFTYTQDSLKFGSQTDKSNLDKTTNTITLLSPYTGKARPAGTAICQATAGSTYFYPFGGISVTTITDWTYKSTVIDPKTTNGRLFWAQYIKYLAYPSAYHAGIQLIDNNANNIVYDSSGYNYHGKVEGILSLSSDTPRNSIATKFNNPSGVFAHPNITFSQYTIAFWAKHSVAGKMLMGSCPSISSNTAWYWYGDNSFKYPSGEFYYAHNAGSAASLLGTWIHFVAVYDGANITVYRNGVNEGSKSVTGSMLLEYLSIGFGYSTAFSEDGYVSDFRVYATALSADDVKKLYNTPVSIANNGSVLTQGEFVEV